MSSIRSQIVEALAAQLRTIKIANGYNTQAGANVFVWRRYALDDSELPALLLRDTEVERQPVAVGNQVDTTMTCEVEGIARGDNGLELARVIESDIVACLAGFNLSGSIAGWMRCLVSSSSLELVQAEQIEARVQVTVAITYQTANHQA